MNKPIVINLFTGPGAGKSTTAAGVFSLLKLHGVNAELITEFAKDLTWEGRHSTLANQYYVTAKQYHRMWRVKDQVDVMITDSPILLAMVYGDNPGAFNRQLFHLHNEFNNVNYFINRVKPYQPKGRNQTEEESHELDKEIKKLLDEFKISYRELPGNHGAMELIVSDILEKLHINTRFTIIGLED
jgi:hypothetical protein